MNERKGRGRGTSEDERALFRTALKDARPLKKRRDRVVHTIKPAKLVVPLPHYSSTPAPNDRAAQPIGGHAEAHLRRGRLEPEARLDLHGFTQDGAYRALLKFLVRAQGDEKRLVLVITGKGGTLRAQLPFWLGQVELRPLVAGASEAHIKHGGGGAFYVFLKRAPRRIWHEAEKP
jgi:DNA-nicking Smr family endonuclease